MRLQLALNVSNLDEAVKFYSQLFESTPAKRHADYANFEIAEPSFKLVLIAGRAAPGTLNHLGVEVEHVEQVHQAVHRFSAVELPASDVQDTHCCYAKKLETWLHDPDGAAWEWYVKTADVDTAGGCSAEPACNC